MTEPIPTAQLAAAKAGNEAALAALIARFMPVVRRYARRAAGPGLDFEDAVQEGIIGLFAAIESWRPGQGAGFPTYATVCIRNAVATAQKAARRKKHAPLNQSVPIPDNESVPGPEQRAIDAEQLQLVLQRARDSLSPLEKQVLRLYLDGYSYAEIAGRLNRSSKTVDNALARIRRKLSGG